MTDYLDYHSLNDLVNFRMEKACRTLGAADFLANGKYFSSAIAHLYYSVFYAVSALLLKKDIQASTPMQTKLMFGLKFIYSGIIDRRYGRIYNELYQCRQAADYEDFTYYDRTTFDELRPQAQEFIERIRGLLAL